MKAKGGTKAGVRSAPPKVRKVSAATMLLSICRDLLSMFGRLSSGVDKAVALGIEHREALREMGDITTLREHLAVQLAHNRRLIAEKDVLVKGNAELARQVEEARSAVTSHELRKSLAGLSEAWPRSDILEVRDGYVLVPRDRFWRVQHAIQRVLHARPT